MSGHRITADLLKADFDPADPGNAGKITATGNWTVVELVTGGSGETRTLADPQKSGQIIILTVKTDGGGDCAVTADTSVNTTGNTVITFGDAGDTVVLTSIPNGTSGYKWIITANDTAALS